MNEIKVVNPVIGLRIIHNHQISDFPQGCLSTVRMSVDLNIQEKTGIHMEKNVTLTGGAWKTPLKV